MDKIKSLGGRIQGRLGSRMNQALAFLLAEAWADVFNSLFNLVIPETGAIFNKILYAFIFTIVISIIAELFTDNDMD